MHSQVPRKSTFYQAAVTSQCTTVVLETFLIWGKTTNEPNRKHSTVKNSTNLREGDPTKGASGLPSGRAGADGWLRGQKLFLGTMPQQEEVVRPKLTRTRKAVGLQE